MLKILRHDVAFMYESNRQSGYAMSDDPVYNDHRLEHLSGFDRCSGHPNALKGIKVNFDIQADHSWWLQALRYTFLEVITSQSKMHMITKMELQWHDYVHMPSVRYVKSLIDIYNKNKPVYLSIDGANGQVLIETRKDLFEAIVVNCAIGLELKAGMCSNYLNLKNIYAQRKNHKMSGWKIFSDWIKTLPNSYLITGSEKVKEKGK